MNTSEVSPVALDEDQAVQVAIDRLNEGASIRTAAEASGLSRRQVAKLSVRPKVDETPFEGVGDTRRISQKQVVERIHHLSTRPQGVKRSEMGAILKERYGTTLNKTAGVVELNMTHNQYRYLKDSVRAVPVVDVNPLFVSEWMPRENALEANSELLRMASDLQDMMTERALQFCERFPGSSYKYVSQEMIKLAIPDFFPGSVQTLCEKNLNEATELDQRVGRLDLSDVGTSPVKDDDLELLCV